MEDPLGTHTHARSRGLQLDMQSCAVKQLEGRWDLRAGASCSTFKAKATQEAPVHDPSKLRLSGKSLSVRGSGWLVRVSLT